MNKYLDAHLCKKYPKIFSERNLPMTQTCMCWGVETGNGWFFLLDSLCNCLQHHIDTPRYIYPKDICSRLKTLWNLTVWNHIIHPLLNKLSYEEYKRLSTHFQFDVESIPASPIFQVVFTQVKEKFGGLRIYSSGGDEYCKNIISFTESLSYHICEVCGRTDELVTAGGKSWIQTTCPKCSKDEDFHYKLVDQELVELWKKVREDERS